MQIIKRGERPEDRTNDARCDNCGTIVLYRRGDIRYQEPVGKPEYPWEPGPRGYVYITCPVCGNRLSTEPEWLRRIG